MTLLRTFVVGLVGGIACVAYGMWTYIDAQRTHEERPMSFSDPTPFYKERLVREASDHKWIAVGRLWIGMGALLLGMALVTGTALLISWLG